MTPALWRCLSPTLALWSWRPKSEANDKLSEVQLKQSELKKEATYPVVDRLLEIHLIA